MENKSVNSTFSELLEKRILKKCVFSKPEDKNTKKCVVAPFKKADGSLMLAVERFMADNKALRENIEYDSADRLASMALGEYRQVNIFTTAGDIELRRSKSGTTHISGKITDGETAETASHNDGKHYIIDPSRDTKFLHELGLSDAGGRIHDKKQAKFRQINRFLEIIQGVENSLPTDRPIVIYDLCCGKSYLTFAVYYYFAVIKGIETEMCGVDLKKDVIDYCAEVAERQGFDGLSFVCANINEYQPPKKPDMVISLHACDIATDFVLSNAVRWNTEIILSTPCCHHEMAEQLKRSQDDDLRGRLDFIIRHPFIKQKLCDILTDSLRIKRLEACGYSVSALELIDPDETPKNLMIRAVMNRRITDDQKRKSLEEYSEICRSLGVDPSLGRFLSDMKAD